MSAMSTIKYSVILILLWTCPALAQDNNGPRLGKLLSQETIQQRNFTVFPNGQGLPLGQGTVQAGRKVYTTRCLYCHGTEGLGDSAEELAGALHRLTDDPPDKTIGTYWPYATTLFDFIRRSMPMDSPGSLTTQNIYDVTAYLLFLNEIIDYEQTIDNKTLANIKMPNRNGFIDLYSTKK
jgi:cytochrome c